MTGNDASQPYDIGDLLRTDAVLDELAERRAARDAGEASPVRPAADPAVQVLAALIADVDDLPIERAAQPAAGSRFRRLHLAVGTGVVLAAVVSAGAAAASTSVILASRPPLTARHPVVSTPSSVRSSVKPAPGFVVSVPVGTDGSAAPSPDASPWSSGPPGTPAVSPSRTAQPRPPGRSPGRSPDAPNTRPPGESPEPSPTMPSQVPGTSSPSPSPDSPNVPPTTSPTPTPEHTDPTYGAAPTTTPSGSASPTATP